MPVYNAAPYLKEAIDSILVQTYKNFDFYIINDGSTDESEAIISTYKDKRIHYLKNDRNRGLVYTLNRGLDIIKNEFIARMDADDISLPRRFEKQLEYMDANIDVAASGTQIEYFGHSEAKPMFPLTHEELKAMLITTSGIVHPTSIFRSKFILENQIRFNEEFYLIEDYRFWLEISKKGKLGNLPQVLLKYRWEDQNVTAKNWHIREARYQLIYKEILSELGIEPNEENQKLHLELALNSSKLSDIRIIRQHLKKLLSQNQKRKIYSKNSLDKVLNNKWDKLFFKVVEKNVFQILFYWSSGKRIKYVQLRYLVGRIFRSRSKKLNA